MFTFINVPISQSCNIVYSFYFQSIEWKWWEVGAPVFLMFCFTVCMLFYKLRLCKRNGLALHPALPAVKLLWPLVPCWVGSVCFGDRIPGIRQASAACLLLSPVYFHFLFLPYFPYSHRGHRGQLYAGSNSETFWILFVLLFEQRSHVTRLTSNSM